MKYSFDDFLNISNVLNILIFVAYIIFIGMYIFYSSVAMKHLKTYGYVGDYSQKIRYIYIIISISIIVLSIIAFIVI